MCTTSLDGQPSLIEPLRAVVQIDGRRGQISMPKQRLYVHQIEPAFQQPGREPMSQAVQAKVSRKMRPITVASHHPPYPFVADPTTLKPSSINNSTADTVSADSPTAHVALPVDDVDSIRQHILWTKIHNLMPPEATVCCEQIHNLTKRSSNR